MANKKDIIELYAVVEEVLPNNICKVKLENGNIVTAYIRGTFGGKKMVIYPQDKVKVEFSVYDLQKGRISFKCRTESKNNASPFAKKSHSSRKIHYRRH